MAMFNIESNKDKKLVNVLSFGKELPLLKYPILNNTFKIMLTTKEIKHCLDNSVIVEEVFEDGVVRLNLDNFDKDNSKAKRYVELNLSAAEEAKKKAEAEAAAKKAQEEAAAKKAAEEEAKKKAEEEAAAKKAAEEAAKKAQEEEAKKKAEEEVKKKAEAEAAAKKAQEEAAKKQQQENNKNNKKN